MLRAYNVPPQEIKDLLDLRIISPKHIKPQGSLKLPRGIEPMRKPHIAYLRDVRGLSRDQAEVWKLGGIGRLGGRLAWRIYVPVYWRGQVVSWTTRGITEDSQRWRAANPEDEILSSDKILYGWDFVHGAAILVEGPGDCWAGGPGFVCPLGMKLSSTQIELLASVPRRGICFDNEPQAQAKAQAYAEQLAGLPGETIVCELEHGADPGETSSSELNDLRREILR